MGNFLIISNDFFRKDFMKLMHKSSGYIKKSLKYIGP